MMKHIRRGSVSSLESEEVCLTEDDAANVLK